MTDHRYRRWGQDALRAQAQAAARGIIAQGRQAAVRNRPDSRSGSVRPLEAAEEPMNRYVHVFRQAGGGCSCPVSSGTGDTALLERLLVAAGEQNQLLVELLAAVNGLTAAVLGIQARLGEMETNS